jgi:adenine-specific DNA-methyltransferase
VVPESERDLVVDGPLTRAAACGSGVTDAAPDSRLRDLRQPTDELVARTDGRRRAAAAALDLDKRAALGQYFTPAQVATFMADMAQTPNPGRVRILDPGAGVGSLTAALVARLASEQPELRMDVVAFEIDSALVQRLEETLADCQELVTQCGGCLTFQVFNTDFVRWGVEQVNAGMFTDNAAEPFDLIVTNPPYKKIHTASSERQLLKYAGIDVGNIYAGFLALAVTMLSNGGQLIAITPRSFANGAYFKAFRNYLLEKASFTRLHVFESRREAFAADAVLQENVIFRAVRNHGASQSRVTLSTSNGPGSPVTYREVSHDEVVFPSDPERFVHISHNEVDSVSAAAVASLPNRLQDIGLAVSTGRVVDFRAREYLRNDPVVGTVPLIYPLHFRDGRINWPVIGARKPNALVECEKTASLLLSAGNYVVVRRMSSKEERRRITAALFDPQDVPCKKVAFENHLNVVHQGGKGLPIELARGLVIWLNSTVVDRAIRQFSGHTQVNAADLRRLRCPGEHVLAALGASCGEAGLGQQKIDCLVSEHVGISTDAS